MKSLSIDIETFSSTNLAKSGVYRYVEAPDFQVLLFGYSADGAEVQVVDLACGEKIPAEIAAALTDDAVTKWAFNASFERVCLSRYIGLPTGEYIDPASWHCSMVWAATMGLPLSLEGVGSVLKLDKQKLTEGKDLIKFFCQPCTPTKVNGQRTRNYPYHSPDKWSAFKKYNARDVETEMSIQAKLAKYPVPDDVWDEYHLDQEINDRGVALDMTLVKEAIAIVTGLGKAVGAVFEIGKNIVTGLWEGIKSLGSWIADKVSGFFSGIVDGAKSLLGIHSPSTVFAGIGENMGLGIGMGFTDAMRGVEKDIAGAIPTDFDLDMKTGIHKVMNDTSLDVRKTVEHTGVIRVEGVNSTGEMTSVIDIIVDRLRQEVRV